MSTHLKLSPPPPFFSIIIIINPLSSFLCSFYSPNNNSLFFFLAFLKFYIMGVAAEAQFHVLAVDDSIIDRKLIERLLKTSSYQVTAVDSGSKALELLGLNKNDDHIDSTTTTTPTSVSAEKHHQDFAVNLIITDYCMPGMTGYDLLRKIKESKYFKDIPVVIMSSENEPARINSCLEEGAEEFFLKPVQLSDVNKLRPHLLKGRARENDEPSNLNNMRKVADDLEVA